LVTLRLGIYTLRKGFGKEGLDYSFSLRNLAGWKLEKELLRNFG